MATPDDADHDRPTLTQMDPNTDPLANDPGAHPVGTSLGAVSAGAAGAALGAVGGPLGVVVGAVVGAVAGAIIGKETAEIINPTNPVAPPLADGESGETLKEFAVAAPPPALPTMVSSDNLAFHGIGTVDPLLQAATAHPLATNPAPTVGPSLPDRLETGASAPRPTPEPPATAPLPGLRATAPAPVDSIRAGGANVPDAPLPPAPRQTPMASLAKALTDPGADTVTEDTPPDPASAVAASSSSPLSERLRRVTFPTAPTAPVELMVQQSYPEHAVREAAYFRYLSRRQQELPGDEIADWTGAEREVLGG